MALARKLTAKIYEIRAHTGKVTCLDLGETGRVLVTGGQDRNVNLWAIGEEKCFMSLTGHNGTIDCVKFAYNDDFVYSADEIGIIRRWDLNAQTISSTLNGHMKSVRTLDFNPSGEYVVSGSNDTTVRLWDVRNQNKCIKNYRGHVANVNSVKFSPDGLWIASAGSEGSIIIWDIRQSKQIVQFVERTSPVTCIQYHPYEFLLAAGRSDGSIFIYDLETNQLVSKNENNLTGSNNTYGRSSVKCITFSENGECLFGGSVEGISVIGWEPDREFDRIESTWSALGDMKIVNRKLICGSHEKEFVSIHALSVDRLHPFYNPSNAPFSHNQSSRKSFSRGNQKLRLSISPTKQSMVQEESEENSPLSIDGGLSSPNLSIEMVDEPEDHQASTQSSLSYDSYIPDTKKSTDTFSNNFSAFSHNTQNIPIPSTQPQPASSSSPHSYLRPNGIAFEGPSSLKMPGELDMYHRFNKIPDTNYHSNDISFGLNDSNPPILANYEEADLEDFPVNNATPPDYAPKMDLMSAKPVAKQKTTTSMSSSQMQKSKQQTGGGLSSSRIGGGGGGSSGIGYQRKLTGVSSVSTMELHKVDDSILPQNNKKQTSVSRFRRPDQSNINNKENNIKNNRNITVQIITKPPSRSKTSFDLRNQSNHVQTAPTKIASYTTDDTSEIHMLASYHDQVYQELSNRHATLQMIRNSTRSHDVVGALKQAIKINGRSVFVDILGAILEKTSTWNLDLCLLLLPEIYELLQSKHKFHYTRACDALRVILSNFLPIIQENIDPWSPARCIGVDISREERQRKCIECQQWLLRIRNLSDSQHIGSTLSQLQNMIVDI